MIRYPSMFIISIIIIIIIIMVNFGLITESSVV